VAVPLLIHCGLAQPTGANVFWELVENDFNSEDWKVRFSAGWCIFYVMFHQLHYYEHCALPYCYQC